MKTQSGWQSRTQKKEIPMAEEEKPDVEETPSQVASHEGDDEGKDDDPGTASPEIAPEPPPN